MKINIKGITLISLVITIIIILILTAVAINLTVGTNGIFRRAKQAGDDFKISEYKERIDIAVLDAKMQNIQEPIDFLGRVKEILENDPSFKDAIIKRVIYENKDTLVIVVSDYAYTVDDNEVKYVGKAKDFTIPDATETNIIFKVSTLDWTNVVNVEIETTEVGYEIQYRIGEKEWNKYTQALEITENTTVDARLIIGSMYGEYVRKTISNIDDVYPTATISELITDGYIGEGIEVTVEHLDNSEQFNMEGCKWVFTTVQEKIGLDESLYTGGTFTENPQTIIVSGNEKLTYYLHVLTTDKAGNKVETVSTTGTTLQTLTFTSQIFSYKGTTEAFTVPASGIYMLEVWGAGGGHGAAKSGKTWYNGSDSRGGYSKGYKKLEAGDVIYVCVGGAGPSAQESTYGGAYNGGGGFTVAGNSRDKWGGGGGATHIAFQNGTLASIGVANLNKILIVAGGGGGGYPYANTNWVTGGSGGGLSGGISSSSTHGAAGTQTSGYAFGQGQTVGTYASGGGGLYGGYGSSYGAGGGSGYIGGVPEITHNGTTYTPSSQNGTRSGNGQAAITFVAF